MLRCLRIKNLAVIEDITWNLEPGLNILTGETGAGKSILIDALNLLLGERADKQLIRHEAESCAVEAIFDSHKDLDAILANAGLEPCDASGLILKRVMTKQGQNRQFINGSPATLQVLKEIGEYLVDMHGPHDHQSLLQPKTQLVSLDAFAALGKEVEAYQTIYRQQQEDRAELETLSQTDAGDWKKKLDFVNFQIQEIEQADLKEREDEIIEQEYHVASNSRRIIEIGQSILNQLNSDDQNILTQLTGLHRLLQEWQRLDPSASNLQELHDAALMQIQEMEKEVERLMERTEIDGERLQYLETRLHTLQTLKRKYGSSVEFILTHLEKLKQEQNEWSHREERILALEKAIAERENDLEKRAAKLSAQRTKKAPELSKQIQEQLCALGFKQAGFSIQIAPTPSFTAYGRDSIDFFFAPNPGEAPRPLRAIASSGEMARVMLAIKTVLSKEDLVPILIFDEIDANVGGETAVTVGRKLRDLAADHQVLCITHLPQVASAGHAHFRVQKYVEQSRTQIRLDHLSQDEQVRELARMLGGESSSALAMAASLLPEATKKNKHLASKK